MASIIIPEGVAFEFIPLSPQGHPPAPAGYQWATLYPEGMDFMGYAPPSLPVIGSVVPVGPACTCPDCDPAKRWKHIEDLDVHSLPISHGKGTPTSPCIIAKASMVHAADQGHPKPWLEFSDWPVWLNQVINTAGVKVNDLLPTRGVDEIWERLNATVPRVVLANRLEDANVERRINARLLCWAVRHVWGDRLPTKMLGAVAEREAWLHGDTPDSVPMMLANLVEKGYPNTTMGAAVAGAAKVDAGSIVASVGQVMLADTLTVIEFGGRIPPKYHRAAAGVKFFELLLDQWEKACAEEGVLGRT